MKISLIVTVLNEERGIARLLNSIFSQSSLPHEVIIVDGGSNDRTFEILKQYSKKHKLLRVYQKNGNRSVGRNEAIKRAVGDVIAITDAGCVLDKKWLVNITKPFINKNIDVVAGYYRGRPKDIFQKSLVPYVLIMPDQVNEDNFLPATRSMAIKKSVWKNAGMFDEKLSDNEDYAFARILQKRKVKIYFEKNAIVYWYPVNSLPRVFKMFYRFAKGDIESGILRPKVVFIFLRYLIGGSLLGTFILTKSPLILYSIIFLLFTYLFWTISKNYRYVNDIRGFIFLPILQITSDLAVLSGSITGKIASENSLLGSRYLFILSIFSIIYVVSPVGLIRFLLIPIILILLLNPLLKVFLLSKKLKMVLGAGLTVVCALILIGTSFRTVRDILPPPVITEKGIVGYVHYFGYPIGFDNLIFFAIIISPLLFFGTRIIIKKNK